jgi:hypothetical protein
MAPSRPCRCSRRGEDVIERMLGQMQSALVLADSGLATVTVTGEAAIRAEPDEAVLWITLSALESAPARRWLMSRTAATRSSCC